MAPARRLRMRQWLSVLLDRGETEGMQWEDRSNAVFRINWKHGSRHGYSADRDALVFRKWAEYTGKLDCRGSPDPKRWKANFRCALNSLKDVQQLSGKYNRGAHAFRLYRFVDHAPHSSAQPIKQEIFAEGKNFTAAAYQYDKVTQMAANPTYIKVESRDDGCEMGRGGVDDGNSCLLTPPRSPEETKYNLNAAGSTEANHRTHYAFTPSSPPSSSSSSSYVSSLAATADSPGQPQQAPYVDVSITHMDIDHLIPDCDLSTMDYTKELENFDGFEKYDLELNGLVINT